MVDHASEELRQSLEDPELAIYHKTPNFELAKEVRNSIGKLNRLNVTLYTINTRGLLLTDTDFSRKDRLPQGAKDWQTARDFQDSLVQIAEETGGVSFYNSQNFTHGFHQVLRDLDHQYLLCYRASEHKKKGEYHRIKVSCKKPGVHMRHRNGYVD